MSCLEPGCDKPPSHPMMLYCAEHNGEQVQMAHEGGFHDWCQHLENEEER